jgi:hypothetical protein
VRPSAPSTFLRTKQGLVGCGASEVFLRIGGFAQRASYGFYMVHDINYMIYDIGFDDFGLIKVLFMISIL